MKKLSIQKLSILSLVLMGASAVTAAVIPSNSKSHVRAAAVVNGSLTISENKDVTCRVSENKQTCFDTITGVDSGNTGVFGNPTRTNGTTL